MRASRGLVCASGLEGVFGFLLKWLPVSGSIYIAEEYKKINTSLEPAIPVVYTWVGSGLVVTLHFFLVLCLLNTMTATRAAVTNMRTSTSNPAAKPAYSGLIPRVMTLGPSGSVPFRGWDSVVGDGVGVGVGQSDSANIKYRMFTKKLLP